MEKEFAQIQKQFGVTDLPHALFYRFENALRFELGGENNSMKRPMLRFAQAYERSSKVAQAFFAHSTDIYVLLSSYGPEKPDKKRLRSLKMSGLKRADFHYVYKTQQEKDDDDRVSFQHWDIAQVTDKNIIPDILWLGIANEMPISPSFCGPTIAYLVDPDSGLLLHVYDDRGMDLVAVDKAPLGEIFLKFHSWLLDYDLDRMTKTFGVDA